MPGVGRRVAEAFGRPLSDVTRDLRFSRGIVAEGLADQDALALTRDLRAMGAEAVTLGEADVVSLPPLQRLHRPRFDAQGLRGEAYTWDRTEPFAATWDSVFMLAVGRVRFSEVIEVAKEEPSPQKRRWAPIAAQFERHIPKLETRAWTEYVLDIVLFDPWRRLRMDENPVAWALTRGADEDQRKAIMEAGSRLHEIDHGVPANRGVEMLANYAPDEAWEPLTFEGKQAFDAYVRWIMQLVRYGLPIPR
jgi:hypothetical protein